MRYALITVLSAALMSPILGGCDKEVSHTDKTTENPLTGNQTHTEQSTMQRPDGSTYTNNSSQTSPGH